MPENLVSCLSARVLGPHLSVNTSSEIATHNLHLLKLYARRVELLELLIRIRRARREGGHRGGTTGWWIGQSDSVCLQRLGGMRGVSSYFLAYEVRHISAECLRAVNGVHEHEIARSK